MKTITENSSNISKYVFADDAVITIEADKIVTPAFIIGDMNSGNATLTTGVTPPEDWTGGKYLFANGTWTANPNWVEPEEV